MNGHGSEARASGHWLTGFFTGQVWARVAGARVSKRLTHTTTLLVLVALLFTVMGAVRVSPMTAIAPTLGTAGSFAVLGGSTVTNTGPTVVNGDLGVWPGLTYTGFPPGIVVPPGVIHPGDAVAQQAQSDLTTAYNALTDQACDVDLTGLDLGGLTLTSGVYCFDTSAQLTGELTLNLQGNPDAVFVFKIGSTLTTAPGSSVIFTNGGPGCNVFWQVGSSATLDTTTQFAGNIVALTSITLNSGANVNGRVLARNGAVTLSSNNITQCVASPLATDTPLPATQTAIAATETLIAMTPTPTIPAATQTAIAATQTAIAGTQTAIAPTLTAIAMTPTPTIPAATQTAIAATQTIIAATQTAIAPTLTAIAAAMTATPTPTATPTSEAPTALDPSDEPDTPTRLYLPSVRY